jgi:hypothetical protein
LSVLIRSLPRNFAPRFCGAEQMGTVDMPYRRGSFALTPPSMMIFVIALVLALFAMLAHYTHAAVPLITSSRAFDALAIAYVVLVIGVLFRRV